MPVGRWAVLRWERRGYVRPMVLPFRRRSDRGDRLWRDEGVGHGRGARAGVGDGVRGNLAVEVVGHGHQKVRLPAPPLEVSRLEGRRLRRVRVRSLPERVAGQEDLGGNRGDRHVCRHAVGKAGTATGTKGCCRWTRWLRCRGCCCRQRQGGSGLGLRGWRPSPRRGRFGCSSVRWA
jgi:hypothetical protein